MFDRVEHDVKKMRNEL